MQRVAISFRWCLAADEMRVARHGGRGRGDVRGGKPKIREESRFLALTFY